MSVFRKVFISFLIFIPLSVSGQSSHADPYWLRAYAVDPYSEYWHVRLKVDNLENAVAKTTSALEKMGGRPAVGIANAASSKEGRYQQLSYQMPAAKAEKALKTIQRMGRIDSLIKNPALIVDSG